MPSGPYLHSKTTTLAADGDGLDGNKKETRKTSDEETIALRWEMMLSSTREVTVDAT